MATKKDSRIPPAAKRLQKTMSAMTSLGAVTIEESDNTERAKRKSRVNLQPITPAASPAPVPGEILKSGRFAEEYAVTDLFFHVPPDIVRVSPLADRWTGEQDYHAELNESFKNTGGQLQPSIVRLKEDNDGNEYLELLAGVMRFRAIEKSKDPEAKLLVKLVDADDETALIIIADENRRRKNPSSYSDALQCKKLKDNHWKMETLEKLFEVKDKTIHKMLKFAELPEEVSSLFGGNIRNLSLRMGYELARLSLINKSGLKKAKDASVQIIAGKITKPEQITALITNKAKSKKEKTSSSKVSNFNADGVKATMKEEASGKIVFTMPPNKDKDRQERLRKAIEEIFGPPEPDKKKK